MITIEVLANDGVYYNIELGSDSNDNDNGTEFSYYGEEEDSNGETIRIEAFINRSHSTVDSDDVVISENVDMTKDEIADLISEQLFNDESFVDE